MSDYLEHWEVYEDFSPFRGNEDLSGGFYRYRSTEELNDLVWQRLRYGLGTVAIHALFDGRQISHGQGLRLAEKLEGLRFLQDFQLVSGSGGENTLPDFSLAEDVALQFVGVQISVSKRLKRLPIVLR